MNWNFFYVINGNFLSLFDCVQPLIYDYIRTHLLDDNIDTNYV